MGAVLCMNLLTLSGCDRIVQSAVVEEKDQTEQKKEEKKETVQKTVAEQVQAPETYQTTIQADLRSADREDKETPMNFTLTADAPVKVPDVDAICLKKIKRVAIPEEEQNKIKDTFGKGQPMQEEKNENEQAGTYLAVECGEPVYNMNEEGIEEVKPMHAVLELEGVKESLDEDLIFALNTIFCSKFGFNMRNNVAHGMLDDQAFQSFKALYIWWFALKFCYLFCGKLQEENRNKINKKLKPLMEKKDNMDEN